MNNIKKALWGDEEIKILNYQQSGNFHPYTCGRNFPECEVIKDIEQAGNNLSKRDFKKDGILIATKEGWVCPCGKYKQDWHHSFEKASKTT